MRGDSLPVSSAPRLAVQTEYPVWKSAKRTPSAAMRSMFGVSVTGN